MYIVAAAATTNNMTGILERLHSCIVLIYQPKVTTSTNFTMDNTTPNQIVNAPFLSMATNLGPVFFLNIEDECKTMCHSSTHTPATIWYTCSQDAESVEARTKPAVC